MFFPDVLLATHVRTDTLAVLSFRCLHPSQTLRLGSQPSALGECVEGVDFCHLEPLTELNGSE